MQWITTPLEPNLLRGALDVTQTGQGLVPHRLPAWVRAQFPDEYLARVEAQPSGVRLAFRTRASAIELDVLPTRTAYVGLPAPAEGLYDLLVDGQLADQGSAPGGNVYAIDMAAQTAVTHPGPVSTVRFTGLSAEEKSVEIWLPQAEYTELIALRTDAPVEPATAGVRVWLHHGSSISHGSTAASPTATWPATAGISAGVELINLGFSGNALLDPFVARVMRDIPADLISLKIGINLVNTDLMRLRAFAPAVHGFLDTIRDGHPTTPLLVISPLLCPMQENTPGPLSMRFDGPDVRFYTTAEPVDRSSGRLTLRIIRDELSALVAARAAHDPNLHYLDGLSLYGEADALELPLPDGLHPNAAAHRLVGERFAAAAFSAGGPFGSA
jgi:lysophospholipase L1-like esterase